MNIKKIVKDILAREYYLKLVEDNMSFADEGGFEDTDMVDFIMILEKKLGCVLPRDIAAGFSSESKMTVGDLVKKVEVYYAGIHPVAGLYRKVDGDAICCLSDEKCSKISKEEVVKNKALKNLCEQHRCVLECNFQRLRQIIK